MRFACIRLAQRILEKFVNVAGIELSGKIGQNCLKIDPRGQATITIFTDVRHYFRLYVCPYVRPHFSKSRERKQFFK